MRASLCVDKKDDVVSRVINSERVSKHENLILLIFEGEENKNQTKP